MNVIRSFIAISLSPEIYQNLEGVLRELKSRLPGAAVRWVPAKNIHLTLKFLGDVSVANVDMLTKMLQTEASRHQPFEISVGGLGAFPTTHRPRVVWVGLQAPAELISLQRGVDVETARLGYASEDRPFSPHLTLGRVSRNASPEEIRQLSEVLEHYKVGFLGAARVQSVHLYRSDLQPSGAVYTRMFAASIATTTAEDEDATGRK
jgi:RNA 2',3'-cyclic 3'-phosphodiesterase